MALLKVYKNGKLLLDECENANHFFTRFMGLSVYLISPLFKNYKKQLCRRQTHKAN